MRARWAHFVCIYLEYMDGAAATAAPFKSCCATCFQNFISIPMKFVCGGVKSIYKEFKTNTRYRFCTVAFNIRINMNCSQNEYRIRSHHKHKCNHYSIFMGFREKNETLIQFWSVFSSIFFLSYRTRKGERGKRCEMKTNEQSINHRLWMCMILKCETHKP